MNTPKVPKVLEKYYSLKELSWLIGFDPKWWAERAKAGELVVQDELGNVISAPAELAGELRVPASAVNAYLARHAYRYDAGVKARNLAELRRRLASGETKEAA